MRVAVALKSRLAELEAQGRLKGVIELVPLANPIGIGQMFQATHQGRFEFNSGKNFNRDFPELTTALVERLEGLLGEDGEANVAIIRRTMLDLLEHMPPRSRSSTVFVACSCNTRATPIWCWTCTAISSR